MPSLLPAFQRLWRRLAPSERRALQRLSVYRSYAPEEIVEPETLRALVRLRLIERDGAGGITLLPALAPIVVDDISPEVRELLHDQAAHVRLERGEYTAAAHHFVAANKENLAVQVWFPQRMRAIARGEADAARLCFGNISRQRLDAPERKALDLIRAELRRRAGENDAGLRELEQADWSADSESSARLWMLRGEMQDVLGFPDQALISYDQGLQVTSRLLGQLVSLRHRRGILLKNRRNLKAGWQESERGEFDLQVLRGLIRVEEGNYDGALHAYARARELAEQLDDDGRRAQAERWISALYGRRQQLGKAVFHAERAIAIYDRLGDRVNFEKMHGSLASIYVHTKQFQAALEVGVPAYEFFLATRHPYDAACAGANLAEASFELGAIDDAQRYAGQVLELGERFAAPYAHFTLGQVAVARHDTAVAITHFEHSRQLAEANEDSIYGRACAASAGPGLPRLLQHRQGRVPDVAGARVCSAGSTFPARSRPPSSCCKGCRGQGSGVGDQDEIS